MTTDSATDPEPRDAAEDAFDQAMREAWRPRGPAPGSSVLAALEALGGDVPRVALRGGAEASDPPAGPAARDAAGHPERYEVLGELGRGGVGVVLKGRDVDLGRDVAMKVLREEHARNPDVLRRFLEEAQIGGQLQHPGVVPVYEMGIRADRRPFFTMKLVEGKTLAALLAERASPATDLHRFLTIFAQVCQTVAYAHSRGVVHRDLKPSNVMVGSFGEVQVMDWGFAKVLGAAGAAPGEGTGAPDPAPRVRTVRSDGEGAESMVGAVMGTPAYMPPEQALGRVGELDTRSDAFALGAILLEILTGRPPYVPESGNLLVQAARVDLAEAFDRLDACGADPVLRRLTRRCLERERADRPHDAGRLAEEVTRHLAAVEERTRDAKAEAAQAGARAAAERKARRLTLALATAALLAVLLGGSGFYLAEAKERERQEQAESVVREAMEEARRLQGEAQADPGVWPHAVQAAERAVALAREQEAGADVLAGAEALLGEVRAVADRALANAARLARLADIRAARGDQLGLKAADAAYAAAFEEFGPEDPVRAVDAIRATGIGPELAAYLDDWGWLRGIAGLPGEHLREIADAVDPDPSRARLRAAAARRDLDALEALARDLGAADLGRGHMANLLALHLASLGEPSRGRGHERAAALLREAQRLRPGDFWLNYQLGFELTLLVPARWEEAIGFYRVALGTNPGSLAVRHELAIALHKTGRYAEAIQVLEDLLRDRPDHLHAYDHLIEAHERNGTLDDLLRGWELARGDWREHYRLGRALEVKGEWRRAVASYERALAIQPSALLHARIGIARQFLGDLDGALESHRRALATDPDLTEAGIGVAFVHYQRNQYEEARAEIQRRIEADPFDAILYDIQGAILGDLGRHEEAVALDQRLMRVKPDSVSGRVRLGAIRSFQGELDLAEGILREATGLPERFAEGRFQVLFVTQPHPSAAGWTYAPLLGYASGKVDAWAHLAGVLAAEGRLPEAADACREAVAGGPSPPAWLLLNLALYAQLSGGWEEAHRNARRVLDVPGEGEHMLGAATELLGYAALALGRTEEARERLLDVHRRYEALHAAEKGGDDPAVHEGGLRRFPAAAEAFCRLRPALPQILEGTHAWSSDDDRLLAAWMLEELSYYRASARLYERVLEERPALATAATPYPTLGHWVGYAARSASRAASGYGADAAGLGDEERLHWRRRLREWIELDHRTWVERAASGDPDHVRWLPLQRTQWRRTLALRPVLAPSNLRKLPDEERRFWESFWEHL